MKTIISFKRSLTYAFAALAILSFVWEQSSAQTTYKRSGIIEEFTGTWCGYCPRGAWFMDSLQDYMPNNAVEICWHNQDEMTIPKVEDSIEAYFGVPGFPAVGFMRTGAGDVSDWSSSNPLYTAMKKVCNSAPLVDCRIVNVAYDPISHVVDLDLDVTPYNMSAMPTEDTETYKTLAVLTEDGLIFDQHNYGLRGLPNPISPFTHYNVARAVGGSVWGDVVTLGTQDPSVSLPVRTHYSFTIDPNNWNPNMLRVKTMFDGINLVTVSGKKYQNNNVMNAAQTDYIATYPSSPLDRIWIVLPNANSVTSPNKPVSVVWAHGGNTSSSAKLEWSSDNGTTWNLVIANTTNSPYGWDLPIDAYGQTVILRASDAANPTVKSISEPFKTPGIMHIMHPALGDTLIAGKQDSISFTGGNIANSKTIDYSTDSMATWKHLGNINSEVMRTFITVPTPTETSTACFIRVTDANGVVGISGQFTITSQSVQPGSIDVVSLTRLINDSIPAGDHSIISWTKTGEVGANISIDYTYDGGISWQNIHTQPATDSSKYNWSIPPQVSGANMAQIRVKGDLDGSKAALSKQFTITPAAGVLSSEAFGYSITNFPNPTPGATTVSFTMHDAGRVTMVVRDQLGREVATVANAPYGAGSHNVSFDASKLATGVYTLTFEANGVHLGKTVNVVK